MNNEIQRKITSLMLMTIMVAGGMTFAAPGFMPVANAANANLFVSAEETGNFAGIQVIEIVVRDTEISDTDNSEGKPNVEVNGKDVFMVQGNDGSWYAYVANQLAIDNYVSFNDIYQSTEINTNVIGDSGAQKIFASADDFLDGHKKIGKSFNNEDVDRNNWPYIQTYNISDNSDVTITYGSGGTAQSTTISYDYDDSKDISLDRQLYPENSFINISLDDSLLNLSPTADDRWAFFEDGTVFYIFENDTSVQIDWDGVGFEEGPISLSNDDDVLEYVNSEIGEPINESVSKSIIFKTHNTDDNLFVNWNNSDESGLKVIDTGESSIVYNDAHSIIFDTFKGRITFDSPPGSEWLSGVELGISLIDEDRNLNSRSDETLSLLEDEVPYLAIGDPIHLDSRDVTFDGDIIDNTDSMVFNVEKDADVDELTVRVDWPYPNESNDGFVFTYVNFDFTDLGGKKGTTFLGAPDQDKVEADKFARYVSFEATNEDFTITFSELDDSTSGNVYFDVISFGQVDDITSNNNDGNIESTVDRVNDAFYRLELEETDDDTANFDGTVEYIMINQLNVFDKFTYGDIVTSGDEIVIIVNDDMDGSDAITVSYTDIGSTGNHKTISANEDANTHTGKIELDKLSYSSGNTITVTLTDEDLNTNSDTVQIYTVNDKNEWVGNDRVWLSQLLIDGELFDDSCSKRLGLSDTGFTLKETSDASGVFIGTLELPANYCSHDRDDNADPTNGLDVEFEYQDYSDNSGKSNESSDSASIRSNTGAVSMDASVYPVPIGEWQFPKYGIDSDSNDRNDFLPETPVVVTISVTDPDFNLASSGTDIITVGEDGFDLELEISRGSLDAIINLDGEELVETEPKSGVFELDVEIEQKEYDFGRDGLEADDKFIHQGDILTVRYTDPNDASGDENSVTDSATFDLRNAVLQTDKSVFIIGSDAIITLIEPDLNLDSEAAETWSLDLINWDSDAGQENLSHHLFNANPAGLRETGDNTGIFQVVIEIPNKIDGDALERGEQITLEYQDHGPAGSDYVGEDDEDVSLDIFTSNFGATITMDQKVYTWTDKVYITVVSPDHNFDSDSIDEIGGLDSELNISTHEDELENYKLVETGSDTGIFTGEVILTGFRSHDADGDGERGDASGKTSPGRYGGPTNGLLEASDDGGISVSFELSDGDIVTSSSLIRWNIAEVQWLEASYPASGSGAIRVIDPDMNLNPESVDSFDVTVWSETVTGGITLRVTETNEATGIFEGTVFFTTTSASSGSRLAVSEGDTVTVKYEDRTLPDPYSKNEELGVTSTTLIGTLVPPLERAPASNLRTVDAFGNSITAVSLDQQIQVQADIMNTQDRKQKFAYLIQIQDNNGVTISLSWITGNLESAQNFSPAISWIPTELGEYNVTVFVWESVDNPTALSPPLTIPVIVR